MKLFQFNEPGIDFSFEERLARENGWTKEYTRRVIDEYKKFIFLCCTSETGITPSDPVDQAWHLHLTFTKSYWIDLCKNTLEKEIHHNPTKGGQRKRRSLIITIRSYLNCISKNSVPIRPQIPGTTIKNDFPISIFNGLNLRQYCLVKKPSYLFKKILLLVCIGLFALLCIQASETSYVWGIIITIIVVIATNKRNNRNNNDCSPPVLVVVVDVRLVCMATVVAEAEVAVQVGVVVVDVGVGD